MTSRLSSEADWGCPGRARRVDWMQRAPGRHKSDGLPRVDAPDRASFRSPPGRGHVYEDGAKRAPVQFTYLRSATGQGVIR